MRGQGATEYLVLLAVVLIVALVSVALLGFFPGMASDAQRQQSEMYWRSASPIAMTEWSAQYSVAGGDTFPYLRVKNNGAYPIRITGIVAPDGGKMAVFYASGTPCGAPASSYSNVLDYFYLAPGEEKYFGWPALGTGVACDREIVLRTTVTAGYAVGGASSVCANSATSPGTTVLSGMGFEYVEYLDNNQQITKRQIGKPVIIKCLPPTN